MQEKGFYSSEVLGECFVDMGALVEAMGPDPAHARPKLHLNLTNLPAGCGAGKLDVTVSLTSRKRAKKVTRQPGRKVRTKKVRTKKVRTKKARTKKATR